MKYLQRIREKRGKTFIFLLAMTALLAPVGVRGQQLTLTVNDGTYSNYYVPIEGAFDGYKKCEMLYEASELSAMIGAEITSLKFYAYQTVNTDWSGVNFKVYLAEVTNTQLTYDGFVGPATDVVAYQGSLCVTDREMTIELSVPFTYQGGNLLVSVYNTTTGSSSPVQWYVDNKSYPSAAYASSGYGLSNLPKPYTIWGRLPKTTFGFAFQNLNCLRPTDLQASNVEPRDATISWTAGMAGQDSWELYYTTDASYMPDNTTTGYIEGITETSYDLTNLIPETTYYVYVRSNCGTDDGKSIWSRKLVFTTGVSCYKPTDLTLVAETTNSATITWSSEVGNYEISYSNTPADPEHGTIIQNVTENTYTFENLSGQYPYYFYIRAICSENDYSKWSDACVFQAPYVVDADHPYYDSFEGTDCEWALLNGDKESAWCQGSTTSGTYPVEEGLYISKDGGESNTYENIRAATVYAYKTFTLEARQYEVKFKWRNEGNHSDTQDAAFRMALVPAATELQVGTTYPNTSDWVFLNVGPLWKATTWQSGISRPIVQTAGDYKVVALWSNQVNTFMFDPAAGLDDFSIGIYYAPPTNVSCSSITKHTAKVSWSAVSSAEQYDLYWTSDSNDVPDEDTQPLANTSSTEYTITGLQHETFYYAYVRANYGVGHYSDWVKKTFETQIGCESIASSMITMKIKAESAEFTWLPSDGENAWKFRYVESVDGEYNVEDFTTITVNDNPNYLLAGLTQGSTYVFQIAAYCGEEDGTSEWSPEKEFTTMSNCSDSDLCAISYDLSNPIYWDSWWSVMVYEGSNMVASIFPVESSVTDGELYLCPERTYRFVVAPRDDSYGDYKGDDNRDEKTSSYLTFYDNSGAELFSLNYWPDDYYSSVVLLSAYQMVCYSCNAPKNLNVNVTEEVAMMTWEQGGSETQWRLSYKLGDNEWIPVLCNQSLYEISLISVEPSTFCQVRLESVCPDNSYSGAVTRSFVVPFCAPENQCSISYYLNDYYCDSWNGAAISIMNGNTVVASLSLEEEDVCEEEGELNLCPGTYSFIWISGDYDEECSFTIWGPDGEVIISQENGFGEDELAKGRFRDNVLLADYSHVCPEITCIFETAGSWCDENNWESGNVPRKNDNVIINAAAVIPSGCVAQANVITLDGDDASITVADGGQLITNSEVEVKVQKNIAPHGETVADGGWYLIASPIQGDVDFYYIDGFPGFYMDYALYYFDENPADGDEWRNVKKEWFNYLSNGKGYLYANAQEVELGFNGRIRPCTPNVDVPLAYHQDAQYAGWNLVGNPFTFNAYVNRSYYKMNANGSGFDPTEQTGTVAPCTGIMVKADETGQSVTFSNEPVETQSKGNLQITLSQARERGASAGSATLDKAIVSFNEGSSLLKFYFNGGKANVFIPQDDKEYAIVFSNGMGEMPINFVAKENGSYTLNIGSEEVDFNYLHLIDNMTGADVDLLQKPSYTFKAFVDDYESRFKLLFATSNADTEGDTSFAFFSNGSLLINNDGEATLQIIDVTGRILDCESINGSCSKVINAVPGVYVLRLINGDKVKVQKIVVG